MKLINIDIDSASNAKIVYMYWTLRDGCYLARRLSRLDTKLIGDMDIELHKRSSDRIWPTLPTNCKADI